MKGSVDAKFTVGQLVCHELFNYRGVIVDVDPEFQGSEEWYERMAKTQPPRDRPWYHVLVEDGEGETYVAERNLTPDDSGQPLNHARLETFFTEFENGRYHPRVRYN